MKTLDESAFTIVGTGLMGTSLALALRKKVKALHGIDVDPTHRAAASPHFDTVSADLDAGTSADVVVLATPIRAILNLLERFKQGEIKLGSGTLIIDLGSVKTPVVAAMNALPDALLAIGGHPMCGKETSGPQGADKALFHERPFVFCPTKRTTAEVLDFGRHMAVTIGARPVVLSADTHDKAAAAISHMPYLLSATLVGTVNEIASTDDVPWQLAASGFRDMSRLAESDVIMMGDTVINNRQAVIDALDAYQSQLTFLKNLLLTTNDDQLRATLEIARQVRVDWSQRWTG